MKRYLALVSMFVVFGLSPAVGADPYPTRTITIIVPLTAGTTVDVVARIAGSDLAGTDAFTARPLSK